MERRLSIVVQRDTRALLRLLPSILSLADSEKEPLGFLPAAALEEAVVRQRMIAATTEVNGMQVFVGYLLHGGVYPHAKVQQIAVHKLFRNVGAASALLKAFISDLERLGFLTLRADVASDLPGALAFYGRNRFESVRQRPGGLARNRKIFVHVRQLDTDSLFSLAASRVNGELDLGIRRRVAGDPPFFVFDLNVFFDLVKVRSQSASARRLFGAALAHDIRLAVADEFVVELRRTSSSVADPILEMALQLPRLPKADRDELGKLADTIHEIVFVQQPTKGARTVQARSDARHLAHAALSRASAFVTRDSAILAARNILLSTVGIDVAALDEVTSLLRPRMPNSNVSVQGDGFEAVSITAQMLSEYLSDVGVPLKLISEFCSDETDGLDIRREAIREKGRIIAVGAVLIPKGVGSICRLLVHVRPEHFECDLFADYLVESTVRFASLVNATSIELIHLPGQSAVSSIVRTRGFFRSKDGATYSKIALGRPLTSSNWFSLAQATRRRTGFTLPDLPPSFEDHGQIKIRTPGGGEVVLSGASVEDILSPTVFVWTGRTGVIVPITRIYADDLLGTSKQANLAFISNRDAAFFSRRGYVNSPRSIKKMRPDSPILFYESKGKGKGRGAVVAVARIVDSVVVKKADLSHDGHRRLVVDGVDSFSSSDDVLFTTFDNLFVIPHPVPYKVLKSIDAIGPANLVTAVSLPSEKITAILTQGWSSD